MSWLGTGEIIVILILALILFGPKKLPELGRLLGSGLRELRKITDMSQQDLLNSDESPAPIPDNLTESPDPQEKSDKELKNSGEDLESHDYSQPGEDDDPYNLKEKLKD